jgi:metal transporter CNNM
MEATIWLGIGFCISQSAMFSGLNLAFFSISKLRLKIESKKGNRQALKVDRLRRDANFLLATILWGNVGINVLLTLLSNSVMVGAIAFLFSTFVITFLGEIIPQAYFSRHALKMAAWLSPVVRLYQGLLYPVAKPTALFLDKWLGAEAVQYFHEEDFRELLKMHVDAVGTDIASIEGTGAINFLKMDDLLITQEGETVVPDSVISLAFEDRKPVFPSFEPAVTDPFLQAIQASQLKWVIITDPNGEPQIMLDADAFLRATLFDRQPTNPLRFCHRPIIVRDEQTTLGDVIPQLKVYPTHPSDDVIDDDIILLWGQQKRIITGSDILGRLMRGIVQKGKQALAPPQNPPQ